MLAIPEIWLPNFGDQAVGANPGDRMDNSYPSLGYLLHIPESGQITHIGFRTRGIDVPGEVQVGLYVPSLSTGMPIATQYGGSAYGTLASPVADITYEVALATPALATKGDAVVVVFALTNSNSNIQIRNVNCSYLNQGFPAVLGYNGTSWVNRITISHPNLYFKMSSGELRVPFGCHTHKCGGYHRLSLNTSPDETGFCFVANTPLVVSALRYATTGWPAPCELCIYENGSLLAKIAQPFASAGFEGPRYLPLPSHVTLTPGSKYHVTYRPTAGDFFYYFMDYMSIELMRENFSDPTICGCQRTDGGSWTYTERMPYISLVCTSIAHPPVNRRTSTGR